MTEGYASAYSACRYSRRQTREPQINSKNNLPAGGRFTLTNRQKYSIIDSREASVCGPAPGQGMGRGGTHMLENILENMLENMIWVWLAVVACSAAVER